MPSAHLADKAGATLRALCLDIPSRRVGSAGNRAACELFAGAVTSFGFQAERSFFDCVDWACEGAHLAAGALSFEVFASPYSLGCQVRAPLAVAASVVELEAASLSGQVLLMRGELAKGQIMPKNFPFYNPDEHKHVIRLLEAKQPLAIVAATSRDLEMVGSMYPFPLFEDGDFNIPSVYMTEEEGSRLALLAGRELWLESRAQRIASTGCNVVARKGGCSGPRVVVMAHIDSRIGSPGASDNASGVVVLLLLAELLAEYAGALAVELVAMNGEDYFSNPGEQLWLRQNEGRFSSIRLGINIDDVGYHLTKTSYSLYSCSDPLAGAIRQAFLSHSEMVEGEPWYQGDHGLLLMNQVPALALTSEASMGVLMQEITHTPRDLPEILDPAKLVQVAHALHDLVLSLE